MAKKNTPVTYKLEEKKSAYLQLRDVASALEYGSVPADRRIQVKMPAKVIDELDKLFPGIDRSKFLTRLALDAILRKLRFADNPDLASFAESEQEDLDTLWNYLEEREKGTY